jgi:hypothetical protein
MGACFNKKNKDKQIKNAVEDIINKPNKDNSEVSNESISSEANHTIYIQTKLSAYIFYKKINDDINLKLVWSSDYTINRKFQYWENLNLFYENKKKVIGESELLPLLEEKKVMISLQSKIKYEKNNITDNLSLGPPNSIRWAVWYSLANYEVNNRLKMNKAFQNISYEELLKSELSTNLEEQINKDLHRTAPNFKFFQDTLHLNSLFNLLKAFASYDHELGYCQGVNLIIANIFLISDGCEKEAFVLIKFFFSHLEIRSFFTKGFPGVFMYLFISKKLIKLYLPDVMDKIDEIGITDEVWLFKWIQSIFSLILDINVFIRLWDCLVSFGLDFLFYFILGYLKFYEPEIKQATDMFEFVEIFKNHPSGTIFQKLKKNYQEQKLSKQNTKKYFVNNVNTPDTSDALSEKDMMNYKYREKIIKYSLEFKKTLEELDMIKKIKIEYDTCVHEGKIENHYYEEGSFYSNTKGFVVKNEKEIPESENKQKICEEEKNIFIECDIPETNNNKPPCNILPLKKPKNKIKSDYNKNKSRENKKHSSNEINLEDLSPILNGKSPTSDKSETTEKISFKNQNINDPQINLDFENDIEKNEIWELSYSINQENHVYNSSETRGIENKQNLKNSITVSPMN